MALHLEWLTEFCHEDPTVDDHAILHGDLRMTLQLDGPTSYFPTRTPTDVELECCPNGPFFEMTGEFPEWDPHTDLFQILESRLIDSDGEIITRPRRNTHQLFSMLTVAQLVDPFRKLCTTVNIPHVTAVARSQVTSHRDNAALLASTWHIDLPAARCTLRATTQRGVREYDGQARTVERRYLTGTVPYGINDCYILSSMILSFPQLNLGVEILHPIYMQLTSGGPAIFPLNPNLTHMKPLMNSFIAMVSRPV